MKKTVYVETSVISYLSAALSRDLVVAANQEVTREWWETERAKYELFVSEFVLAEIREGDAEAAQKRLNAVSGIKVLAVNDAVLQMAREIIRQLNLSDKMTNDIAHIALATVHGMDYVLTWNCAHIANPHWQTKLDDIARLRGFDLPVICTPQALLEGELK